MAAYAIISYDITDPDTYEPYVPAVVQILQKHGAEILVGDFDATALEGECPGVNVVLRFDSEEKLRDWYDDPEYQPVRQIRLDSTENGTIVLAQEFELPSE